MSNVMVKPTGVLPLPLPPSMRRPGRSVIPLAGMSVPLTRYIKRRLAAGDLVRADAVAAAVKPAPAASGAAKETPAPAPAAKGV